MLPLVLSSSSLGRDHSGIDLVEQMIRIAAGEPLAIKQGDVKLSGSAVGSRIYAEDPYRNFLPSTGRLVKYRQAERIGGGIPHLCGRPLPQFPALDRPPGEVSPAGRRQRGRHHVCNDTGVYEAGEISIYYDPMIAKLVTHAELHRPIRHNIPFL